MPYSRPDPSGAALSDEEREQLKSFEEDTAKLAHAITTACDGHDMRVVLATISTVLAYTLVQATRGPEGLDSYLEIMRADVHDLWRRKELGLPFGGRVN
jgi:hypothetical protein